MVARAKADLSSVAPDNNVRYMALQALAGLTGVQLQIFLRQAPEVNIFLLKLTGLKHILPSG